MLERSPNTTGFKSMLPRSILEFVVLVTGLLMTFYIEDRNELQYRVAVSYTHLTLPTILLV